MPQVAGFGVVSCLGVEANVPTARFEQSRGSRLAALIQSERQLQLRRHTHTHTHNQLALKMPCQGRVALQLTAPPSGFGFDATCAVEAVWEVKRTVLSQAGSEFMSSPVLPRSDLGHLHNIAQPLRSRKLSSVVMLLFTCEDLGPKL